MIFYPDEYVPDYHEREQLKTKAWESFKKGTNDREKAFAILQVCRCHYWRAGEALDANPKRISLLRKVRGKKYYGGYELEFDHYIPHWLFAQSHLFPDDVMKEIKNTWHYEPEESKYLPKGYTQYILPEIKNDPV